MDGDSAKVKKPAGRSQKARTAQPINRPVIAICNDLYAPALRPLREIAAVFNFRTPPSDKLVGR